MNKYKCSIDVEVYQNWMWRGKGIKREGGDRQSMKTTNMKKIRVLLVTWFQAIGIEPHKKKIQVTPKNYKKEYTKNKRMGRITGGKPEGFQL